MDWRTSAAVGGGRLRAVSGIRPEHGVAARIATRGRSQPGCIHARVCPTGRLRVVQPPALGACLPLPGLGGAFEDAGTAQRASNLTPELSAARAQARVAG
jgi:hypothetical protein